jgi:hypothetical protein
MFDFALMQYQLEEAIAKAEACDPRTAELIAELQRAHRAPSLRRRVAGAIVGFALKLDPEAAVPPAVQPNFILEAAHVRS